MSAVQQLASTVGQAAACRALGVPRASWYRSLQPVAAPAERTTPARALPPEERQVYWIACMRNAFRTGRRRRSTLRCWMKAFSSAR